MEKTDELDDDVERIEHFRYYAGDLEKKVDVDVYGDEVDDYVEVYIHDADCLLVELDHEHLTDDSYSFQLRDIEYFHDDHGWLIQMIVQDEIPMIYDYFYDDVGNLIRQELSYEGGDPDKYWDYDYSCWE